MCIEAEFMLISTLFNTQQSLSNKKLTDQNGRRSELIMELLKKILVIVIVCLSVVQVHCAKSNNRAKRATSFECGIPLNSTGNVFNGETLGRYEFPW